MRNLSVIVRWGLYATIVNWQSKFRCTLIGFARICNSNRRFSGCSGFSSVVDDRGRKKIPKTDDLSNSENRVTIGIKFLTTKVCVEDGIRNMWIPLDLGNLILLPV